jgi:SAM-dependent methyltransferase
MSAIPCVVCDSLQVEQLFQTHDRHYGITGEFNVVRCARCGLVRMDPIPSLKELGSFYSQDYYAYRPLVSNSFVRAVARKLLKVQINTHNPVFERPGTFLDIGCGSGEYLHLMKAKGWQVKGVEPSQFGASQGQREGLEVVHGTLLDAHFPDNSFDYIRSNHSFEHVPNPDEVLREVHRILKPDGKLFLGIPNTASIAYKVFGKYWWYLGIPVHTFSYSTSNISALLRRTGFHVDRVYYQSNYSSILGSLQIYLNRNTNRKSTEGMLIRNPLLKVTANVLTRLFDLVRAGDAIEVIASKGR